MWIVRIWHISLNWPRRVLPASTMMRPQRPTFNKNSCIKVCISALAVMWAVSVMMTNPVRLHIVPKM